MEAKRPVVRLNPQRISVLEDFDDSGGDGFGPCSDRMVDRRVRRCNMDDPIQAEKADDVEVIQMKNDGPL
eukprot:2687054-Amphidinium_carterae.1